MPDVEVDEFSLLAADAQELNVAPVGSVSRLTLGSAELSAIAWGEVPARFVFLHGAALNAHTWDQTLLAWNDAEPTLAAPFLALDLPGHGESPWRSDAHYDPDVIAPSVADALADGIARGVIATAPTVIGQSLGGLVALLLASDPRLAVRHIVLVDILPLDASAANVALAFLQGAASFTSREQIVEFAAAAGLGGTRGALERAVWHNTRIDSEGRAVWKHHLGSLGGAGLTLRQPEPLWRALETAPEPVDLVYGARGVLSPELRGRFRAARPVAQIVELAGGHNLQEDVPRELARTLRRLVVS